MTHTTVHTSDLFKQKPERIIESQNRQVLNWLKSGNGLTAKNAADYFGIYRLSARIYDLRKAGHIIHSVLQFDGSAHWSVYRLARPQLKPGIKSVKP